MDHGRVMEEGPHDALLKIPIEKSPAGEMVSGWYHDLWNTQMGKGSTATTATYVGPQIIPEPTCSRKAAKKHQPPEPEKQMPQPGPPGNRGEFQNTFAHVGERAVYVGCD